MAAALSELRRFGSKRLTVEDVAREANVSRPTVYAHFSNKQGVIEAALLLNGHQLRERLEAILSTADTFADKVAASALFGITTDSLNLSQNEPVTKALLLTIYAEPWIERATSFWEPIVDQAIARGEVRRDLDPRETARWISRSLFLLALTSSPNPPPEVVEQVDRWARTYLAGGLEYHRPPTGGAGR